MHILKITKKQISASETWIQKQVRQAIKRGDRESLEALAVFQTLLQAAPRIKDMAKKVKDAPLEQPQFMNLIGREGKTYNQRRRKK